MSRKHENEKRICSISFHFFLEKGRNGDACVVLCCWSGRDVSPLPPSLLQRKGEESWQGKDKICSLLSPTPGLEL